MRIADIPGTNRADYAPADQARPRRAAWSKPALRRLALSEAENGVSIFFDAAEGFS